MDRFPQASPQNKWRRRTHESIPKEASSSPSGSHKTNQLLLFVEIPSHLHTVRIDCMSQLTFICKEVKASSSYILDLRRALDWPILWFLHQIPPVQVVLISSSAAWFGVLDAQLPYGISMNFKGFKLFAFIPLVCHKSVGFCPVLLKKKRESVTQDSAYEPFPAILFAKPRISQNKHKHDEESAEVQCKAPNTVELCWTYAATSCTQQYSCLSMRGSDIRFIALASALPDPPQPIASDILMYVKKK